MDLLLPSRPMDETPRASGPTIDPVSRNPGRPAKVIDLTISWQRLPVNPAFRRVRVGAPVRYRRHPDVQRNSIEVGVPSSAANRGPLLRTLQQTGDEGCLPRP